MAKMNWKAVDASEIVKAPKIQVSPKRTITPKMLKNNRQVFDVSFSFPSFSLYCSIITLISYSKMTDLQKISIRLATRYNPKNTPFSPMNQLLQTM